MKKSLVICMEPTQHEFVKCRCCGSAKGRVYEPGNMDYFKPCECSAFFDKNTQKCIDHCPERYETGHICGEVQGTYEGTYVYENTFKYEYWDKK